MTFISDTNKFIFIEAQKTATKSFRWMFRRHYKIENLLHGGKILEEHNRHRTSKHIRNRFPDRWKEYTTFSIVRNPWHRYASWKKWLESTGIDDSIYTIVHKYSSITDFIFDKDKLIIDKVLRLENIQKEWDDFSSTIGLYPRKLPWKNNLGIYDYHDYYDDDLIDTVYKKEKKIIDMMGYTYD